MENAQDLDVFANPIKDQVLAMHRPAHAVAKLANYRMSLGIISEAFAGLSKVDEDLCSAGGVIESQIAGDITEIIPRGRRYENAHQAVFDRDR